MKERRALLNSFGFRQAHECKKKEHPGKNKLQYVTLEGAESREKGGGTSLPLTVCYGPQMTDCMARARARSLVGEIRERGEGELLQSGDVMEVIRSERALGRDRDGGRRGRGRIHGFADGTEWKRKVVPK